MAPFDYAQIPGHHQISHGLEDGKLLKHLPDFSHQRSARYLPQSPIDSFLDASLQGSSMALFDSAQIPGNHQISHGFDDGELLEHLRNAPIFSPQRSPRFLDYDYLPPSPDFFGLHFDFDTLLPPSPTDSVSPVNMSGCSEINILDFPWLAEWLSKEKRTVEITNPSMDEKLDARQLDSSEQQMKNAMETPKRKRGTKRVITLEDLQPLFGLKREDAAKILGVSVSTFKRHSRSNGITWWNGNDCSRSLELDPKHRETTGEKKTPSCKTPSITGQTETGNQVLDNSIVEIEGKLQEQNSFQTENCLKEVAAAVSEGDSISSWPMLPCSDPAPKQSVVTIKATYGEDIVKFDLSSTPGIVELKEEMAKRLELESESFKVKYQDEDQEWILIACDATSNVVLNFQVRWAIH